MYADNDSEYEGFFFLLYKHRVNERSEIEFNGCKSMNSLSMSAVIKNGEKPQTNKKKTLAT